MKFSGNIEQYNINLIQLAGIFVIGCPYPGNSKDQIAKNLIREDKQLNESDIEQMITSGRIIETDYGHLFDEIIINLSQEQTQRVS